MLKRAEKILGDALSELLGCRARGKKKREESKAYYHDAKAEAQRAREERIAVLDAEVLLAGNETHKDVHTDDAGAKHTCCPSRARS